MKYKEFKSEIEWKIIAILGEWNTKRDTLCRKCFNKRMTVDDTVSHIIMNS